MIFMKYLKLIVFFLVLVGCSNKGEKQANTLLSKSFFLEKSINEINTTHVQNAFSKYRFLSVFFKSFQLSNTVELSGMVQKCRENVR